MQSRSKGGVAYRYRGGEGFTAKECEMLRKKRLLSWEDVKEAGEMECRSGSAEIVLSLEKGWSGAFEIWFFDSGDGQEFTRLFYAQDGEGWFLTGYIPPCMKNLGNRSLPAL